MRHRFIKHFVTFAKPISTKLTLFTAKNYFQKLAKKSISKLFFITLGLSLLAQLPSYSKVVRVDEVDLAGKHYNYLYEWSDADTKPKAIILAIHGLTLHGKVYDQLANHLAQEGFIVLAPDLPGYGRRWQKDSISYFKGLENLADILDSIKSTYKNLPIICMGESLGANLALATAQNKADVVDGIILSNPALKTRVNITPKTTVGGMNLLVSLIKTDIVVDLAPYMRAYASEDPAITNAMLSDPLIHKQIKGQSIWESFQGIRPVYKQAKLINKTTPVLILQGKEDKILDAHKIIKLVSSLNSEDQTVKWFNKRGHTLLEECEPRTEILQTLDDWLKAHVDKLAEAKTTAVPMTSALPPITQTVLNAASTTE